MSIFSLRQRLALTSLLTVSWAIALSRAYDKICNEIAAKIAAQETPAKPPNLKNWDDVDEASWESFPASDPPSSHNIT